jgi:hypothetical protein
VRWCDSFAATCSTSPRSLTTRSLCSSTIGTPSWLCRASARGFTYFPALSIRPAFADEHATKLLRLLHKVTVCNRFTIPSRQLRASNAWPCSTLVRHVSRFDSVAEDQFHLHKHRGTLTLNWISYLSRVLPVEFDCSHFSQRV